MNAVCVFCGSSSGIRAEYATAATQLGTELARRGMTLVYGGAKVGLMGTVADAALEHGGRVIGVMPQQLVDREIAHRGLTQLHIVGSMHERKALMIELSDAFVLLPGGFGSWDEFCEAVTWRQLGIHQKPLGVVNVVGYYETLLALTKHSVAEGFVRPTLLDAICVDESASSLLDRMALSL